MTTDSDQITDRPLASIPSPVPMEMMADGRWYRTATGSLIAYAWRPGHATRYYSTARRVHLFTTPRGRYFCQEQETEPESNNTGPFGWTRLRVLAPAEALRLYLAAEHKLIAMERAFPGIETEA